MISKKTDYLRAKFRPLKDKTLINTLSQRLHEELPRIGGPRARRLFSEIILDTVRAHLVPRERVAHGHVVWMAIAVDDPPKQYRKTSDTRMVPVILELSTAEDVDARIERVNPRIRLRDKALRLCGQAYKQGGVLSNSDLAELLCADSSHIGTLLAEYEREKKQVIPRRATIHDVGTGVTHKRIICLKRYTDGKPSHVIAKETWHNQQSVDRYLAMFARVKNCREQKLSKEQTAFTLNCGEKLVQEYWDIDDELSKNKNIQ